MAATTGSIFKSLGVPVKPQASKAAALSDDDILAELQKRGIGVDYVSKEAPAQEDAGIPQPFMRAP
jgi:hypothetical protein